ncbi:MAG: hypothetical protein DCC75_06790 [Proteobacteria bacterium]|nr:MAG: hypothetical protein DCC75_06790 [Pseudomonadota bacterium]
MLLIGPEFPRHISPTKGLIVYLLKFNYISVIIGRLPRSMPSLPPPSHRPLNWPLVWLLVFILSYLLINWSEFSCYCPRSGDLALLELQIEKAKNFALLSGPYSRFHFNHPGPIHSYSLAGLGALTAFSGCPASLSQFILNAIFLVWSIFLLRGLGAKNWQCGLVLFFLIALCGLERRGFWHLIWNPAAVVPPMFLFFIASAGVSLGRTKYLLPLLFGASFAVQSHLGSLPVAAIVTLGSCFLYARAEKRPAPKFIHFLALFLVAIITFLPPLYDLIANRAQSNLYRLALFLISAESNKGFIEALGYVTDFYAAPFRYLRLPYPRLILLLLLLLPAFSRFGKGSFEGALKCIWLAAVFGSLLAASRIDGRFYGYLMWYQHGLVAIYLLLVASAIGNLSPRLFTARLHGVVCLIILIIIPFATVAKIKTGAKICRNKDDTVLALDREALYKISFGDRRYWGKAAKYALLLYRQGFEICVQSNWEFLFGRDLGCERFESSTVRKIRVLRIGGNDPPPGYTKLKNGVYISEPLDTG